MQNPYQKLLSLGIKNPFIEAVSDELPFHQVRFPDMVKNGVLIIENTPIEKFGIHMENGSEIRVCS